MPSRTAHGAGRIQEPTSNDPRFIALEIIAALNALPVVTTPTARAVRQGYSRKLKRAEGEFVLAVAREVMRISDHRWFAYELIQGHPAAFRLIGAAELEHFGAGINSWWTVDSFGRTLSGPAWRDGLVSDELIQRWARSPDRWWRRAALVSTVALNVRSKGGRGDVPRTLAVCSLLVDDHDDMVAKALSWALRELVVHDPQAVSAFLAENQDQLAARVRREVNHKLQTGLKNPRPTRRAETG